MDNIKWMELLKEKKDSVNVVHSKRDIGNRNKEVQRVYWQNFNNKFVFGINNVDCDDKDMWSFAEYVDGHKDC